MDRRESRLTINLLGLTSLIAALIMACSPAPASTATAIASATPVPTATATAEPTATATPTKVPTATSAPTATATVEPTATATPTKVPTATVTPTKVPTVTPLPSATPSRMATLFFSIPLATPVSRTDLLTITSKSPVDTVAFSQVQTGELQNLVAWGEDQTVQLYSPIRIESGKVRTWVDSEPWGQYASRLVTSTRRLVISSWIGWELKGHTDRVTSVSFNSDGLVASGSLDGTVRLWRLTKDASSPRAGMLDYSPNLVRTINHLGMVISVVFSPDGNLLAAISASEVPSLRVWRVSDGSPVGRLDVIALGSKMEPRAEFRSIVFFSDSSLLAMGTDDGEVLLWRLNETTLTQRLQVKLAPVNNLAFSPDGSLLAVGAGYSIIQLWRVNDWRLIGELEDPISEGNNLAFSPDGTLLASGGDDGIVRLRRVKDWVLARELKGHRQTVTSISFRPDGRFLASGSADGTIILWGME